MCTKFSFSEPFIHTHCQQTAYVWKRNVSSVSSASVFVPQMTLLEGNIAASGGFAYVSQQAWILNDSLKGNILFGNDYNQDR